MIREAQAPIPADLRRIQGHPRRASSPLRIRGRRGRAGLILRPIRDRPRGR